MTLIEAVLISTECKDLSELKSLPKEKKLKLASAFGKLKEEQASLDDWNTILASFGEKAKNSSSGSYLASLLYSSGEWIRSLLMYIAASLHCYLNCHNIVNRLHPIQ